MGQKGVMGPKGIRGDKGEQVYSTIVYTTDTVICRMFFLCREIMENRESLDHKEPRE